MSEAIISRRGWTSEGKPELRTEVITGSTNWIVPKYKGGSVSVLMFGRGGNGGIYPGGSGWMNNGQFTNLTPGQSIPIVVEGSVSFGTYLSANGGGYGNSSGYFTGGSGGAGGGCGGTGYQFGGGGQSDWVGHGGEGGIWGGGGGGGWYSNKTAGQDGGGASSRSMDGGNGGMYGGGGGGGSYAYGATCGNGGNGGQFGGGGGSGFGVWHNGSTYLFGFFFNHYGGKGGTYGGNGGNWNTNSTLGTNTIGNTSVPVNLRGSGSNGGIRPVITGITSSYIYFTGASISPYPFRISGGFSGGGGFGGIGGNSGSGSATYSEQGTNWTYIASGGGGGGYGGRGGNGENLRSSKNPGLSSTTKSVGGGGGGYGGNGADGSAGGGGGGYFSDANGAGGGGYYNYCHGGDFTHTYTAPSWGSGGRGGVAQGSESARGVSGAVIIQYYI